LSVLVKQTAEDIASVDSGRLILAGESQSDGWIRRLQLERPVRPMRVVVLDRDAQDALVLQGLALAVAAGDVQRDGVLVVGDDVVELDPEGAGGELQRPGEEVEDVVHATMITRQAAPAGRMPDGV
jgi:hypothetical protein